MPRLPKFTYHLITQHAPDAPAMSFEQRLDRLSVFDSAEELVRQDGLPVRILKIAHNPDTGHSTGVSDVTALFYAERIDAAPEAAAA